MPDTATKPTVREKVEHLRKRLEVTLSSWQEAVRLADELREGEVDLPRFTYAVVQETQGIHEGMARGGDLDCGPLLGDLLREVDDLLALVEVASTERTAA